MNWETVRLGDYVNTLKGFAFKSAKYTTHGVPIVRASNFTTDAMSFDEIKYYSHETAAEYNKYRLAAFDVLVQTVGSWQNNPASVVGKVVCVPRSFCGALLNQNIVKLSSIDDELLDNRFLYYKLKGNDFKQHNLGNAVGAANQASITLDTIRAFQLKLPPLPIQRRIVNILSAYDDLIENNQKQIKLLEEAAMRLYKEWFVQLRFPGHETTPIVDGVPEGWKKTKTKELLKLNYGKALKAETRKGIAYPVYGSSGIVGFNEDYLVEAPVIILGRKGNVGSVFLSFENVYPIDTVYYISTDLSPYYVFFELQSRAFVNSDSAVPGLNRTYAESMEMLCPSDPILNKFDEAICGVFGFREKLSKQILRLRQARDKLLPKLMNGEIEV